MPATIKENVLRLSIKYKLTPVAINQGMWYIGAESFNLIIDNLTSIDI